MKVFVSGQVAKGLGLNKGEDPDGDTGPYK